MIFLCSVFFHGIRRLFRVVKVSKWHFSSVRRFKMRLRNAVVPKALVFVVLWLFLTSPGGYAGNDTIKIGFVGDFSDVTKEYCLSAFNAAQMAVQEINAAGGLLGRPVVLIKKDGGANPQKHFEQFTALARNEKVVAVFGGASSACLLKASEAAKEQRIPYLISVGNTQSVVVEKGHDFVFLFEANAWMETKGFSIFATLMPWQRYAWLGPDYIWGREVFGYFRGHFEDMGTPVEWVAEAWHPLDHPEYNELIAEVMDAKPDALVIASWGEDMRRFILQSKPHGLFDNIAAFGWFMTEDAGRLLPEGFWTITRAPFNYLAEKYPQTERFVKQFQARFKACPIGFTICCYDSLTAWKQAVLKAGTAEPVAVAKNLKGLSFEGLRGKSHIRSIDGQMNCPAFFGRLVYRPDYPSAVMESVIEIPATKTWLPEEEVKRRRNAAKNP
jgi:branched-chain amino acid transport system substrate-binding protein